MVLEQGIIEGRKTYANMIKYIKMTASSNFGNMFSVLVASALLPFHDERASHLPEPDLRLKLHGNSLGQCGRGIHRKAPEMGRLQRGQLHALDRAHQFHLRLYHLYFHVLCVLTPVRIRRHPV